MNQKQSRAGKANNLTRRRFMRDSAMTAAGLAVGLSRVLRRTLETRR